MAPAPHHTIDQAASKHRKAACRAPVRSRTSTTRCLGGAAVAVPVDVVASQEFAVHTATAATDAADGFPGEQRTVVIPTVAPPRIHALRVSGPDRLLRRLRSG